MVTGFLGGDPQKGENEKFATKTIANEGAKCENTAAAVNSPCSSDAVAQPANNKSEICEKQNVCTAAVNTPAVGTVPLGTQVPAGTMPALNGAGAAINTAGAALAITNEKMAAPPGEIKGQDAVTQVVQPVYGRPVPLAARPFTTTPKEGAAALVSYLIGYIFINYLLFAVNPSFGLGKTLFTFIFVAWAEFYIRQSGYKAGRESYFWLAILLCCGISFGLYESSQVFYGVNFVFLCAVAAYWVLQRSGGLVEGETSSAFWYDCYNALLRLPFGNFVKRTQVVFANIKNRTPKEKVPKATLAGVATLLLAMPVLLFAANTLAGADLLFAAQLKDILNFFTLSDDFAYHLFMFILGLPVGGYLFGLVYGAVRMRAQAEKEKGALNKYMAAIRFAPAGALAIVLFAFCGLYALFFKIQAGYLFSAFSNMLPAGFTAAEYARQGFFELCTITALNTGLLAAVYTLVKEDAKNNKFLRIAASLLCFATVIFCGIAFSKMWLYINRFGLTPKRLSTSCFMLFLALATVLILISLYRPFKVVRSLAFFGAAAFCAFCLANPIGICVRTNAALYSAGALPQLDIVSLCDYGAEGALAVIDLSNNGLLTARDQQRLVKYLKEQDYYWLYNADGWSEKTLTHVYFENAKKKRLSFQVQS